MKLTVRILRRALAPAFLLAALSSPARLFGQSFALGGGVAVVNDVGSAAITSGFQTWGGHVFGELTLDKGIIVQVRAARFTVRGSGTGAPNIPITAASATVAYLVGEEWFKAGFFGGVGGYFLRPNTPGPGEEVIDGNENAFGWTGGLITIFEMGSRWDVRLEGAGHLIRSSASRKPLEIGIGVGYHF